MLSVKIYSPPPLPERTPASFILASEHNTPVRSEWRELQSQKESDQNKSEGLITSGSEKWDHPAGLCVDCPPTFRSKKDQIPESPTEATDTGFGNCCGKPKGPRDLL